MHFINLYSLRMFCYGNFVIFEINKLFHFKLGVHYCVQLKLNGQVPCYEDFFLVFQLDGAPNNFPNKSSNSLPKYG